MSFLHQTKQAVLFARSKTIWVLESRKLWGSNGNTLLQISKVKTLMGG